MSRRNHLGSERRVSRSKYRFFIRPGRTSGTCPTQQSSIPSRDLILIFLRLQRKTSASNSVTGSQRQLLLSDQVLRASPSEFAQDYSVPKPPSPTTVHPALRPPAARNASSGNLRTLRSAGAAQMMRTKTSNSSLRPGGIRPRSPNPANASTMRMDDRPKATPPLPAEWTIVHDRAICVLDARGYTLEQSISKLRRAFPELIGSVMTPMMIDKRLRILDQNPEIDYFKVGMKFSSKRSNIAGDTTVMDKIPSVRPITDRPPQIGSSPLRSRIGRYFLNDEKENHNPAISTEKTGERSNSSFADALDRLFLDEAVLVSAMLTIFEGHI